MRYSLLSQIVIISFVLFLSIPIIQADEEERGIEEPVFFTDKKGKQVGLYKGSYALLIGVVDYKKGWPDLDSITGETDRVEAVLKKQGFQVEKVIDPDSRELKMAFDDFINKYGYDEGNRLLFFYSGHGYTRKGGKKGYLVPADAPNPTDDDMGFVRKALNMNQVLTWARNIESKHALFLFDSCFSGTIFETRSRAIPRHIDYWTSKPVRQFISAGSAGEEVPAKSVFVPSFIRGVEGKADVDGDGYVTGTELGSYLYKKVIYYDKGQTPQFGKIKDPDLDEGDFVFAVPGKDTIGDIVSSDMKAIKDQQDKLAAEKDELEADIKKVEEQEKLAELRKQIIEMREELEEKKKRQEEEKKLLIAEQEKLKKATVYLAGLDKDNGLAIEREKLEKERQKLEESKRIIAAKKKRQEDERKRLLAEQEELRKEMSHLEGFGKDGSLAAEREKLEKERQKLKESKRIIAEKKKHQEEEKKRLIAEHEKLKKEMEDTKRLIVEESKNHEEEMASLIAEQEKLAKEMEEVSGLEEERKLTSELRKLSEQKQKLEENKKFIMEKRKSQEDERKRLVAEQERLRKEMEEVNSLEEKERLAAEQKRILEEKQRLEESKRIIAEKKKLYEKEKKLRARWSGWQDKIQLAMNEASDYDNNTRISASEKAKIWQKMVELLKENNPYSDVDEEMRGHAEEMYKYWRDYKVPPRVEKLPVAFQSDPALTAHTNLRSSYMKISKGRIWGVPNVAMRSKESWGFYGHSIIKHNYEAKVINSDKVVIDHNIGLMWHQSGSIDNIMLKDAERWLMDLNSKGYAGYNDWRLPTLEEATSLLTFERKNARYIDPLFDQKPFFVWTGDSVSGWGGEIWVVNYLRGCVQSLRKNKEVFVRPVRTTEPTRIVAGGSSGR